MAKRECAEPTHSVVRSICSVTSQKFEFRYNNRSGLGVTDGERTAKALKGIEGKRLTYHTLTKIRNRNRLLGGFGLEEARFFAGLFNLFGFSLAKLHVVVLFRFHPN